jgi:hypothetical protein
MWPRVVEAMLGLWLMASPFIFRQPAESGGFPWFDVLCGLAILVLSLASFSEWFGWAHLLTVAVGCSLMGLNYFSATPQAGPAQNQMVVGLLLAMLAIIPNDASLPPHGWRARWESDRAERQLSDVEDRAANRGVYR